MKKNLNIKKGKIIIIICIIMVLVILIPNLIKIYNEFIPTKVNDETKILYDSAFQLYNEGISKFKKRLY